MSRASHRMQRMTRIWQGSGNEFRSVAKRAIVRTGSRTDSPRNIKEVKDEELRGGLEKEKVGW